MKYVKNIEQFLNEKVEYASQTINGKTTYSQVAGTTSSLKEFEKMIDNLPKTIKYLEFPMDTDHFNPKTGKIKGPISSSDKKNLKKLMKELTEEYKKSGDKVTKYVLKSYYGYSNDESEAKDPFYIQIRTKRGDKFGDDMRSGKYGSLD